MPGRNHRDGSAVYSVGVNCDTLDGEADRKTSSELTADPFPTS